MALKIKLARNDAAEPEWFHVARTEDGRLVGWKDEDEEDLPFLAELEKGPQVLVSPWDSVEAARVRGKVEKRYRQLRYNDGTFPPEIARRIGWEIAARLVLHGWKGLDFGDELEGDYTPAKGTKAFQISREFEDLVVSLSMNMTDQRRDDLAEDASALGNASSGSSGGKKRRGTKEAESD